MRAKWHEVTRSESELELKAKTSTLARAPKANGRPRPLVSVVLPTRDRPRRLSAALSSVLSQTYPNLEVLVVDDASTDPVEEVVENLSRGDRRVRLIRLSEKSGAAVARNTAFADARGELVAFIDDDDLWKPQKLEKQVAFLEEHPDMGIVTSDHEVIDERWPDRLMYHLGPRTFTSQHLLWFNIPGSLVCCIVRRDVVGDDLWLDESYPSVEDWDLWVRCARHTKMGVVKEVLGRRTLHADGRLSDPASKLNGLRAFERSHSRSMSPACLAFLRAHQRMEMGAGWQKRLNVARSLLSTSPRASALLLLEQSARQVGNVRGDFGLVDRVLARTLSTMPNI